MREPHAVNILNDERQGTHLAQNTVELPVEEVDPVSMVTSPALAVSLARVTPGENIGLRKSVDLPNVTGMHGLETRHALIELAGRLAELIGPDGLDAGGSQANVAASATGE